MASYKCDVSSILFKEIKEWLLNIGCSWITDVREAGYLYIDSKGIYYGKDTYTFMEDMSKEVSYEEFKTHVEILRLMGNPA